MNDMTSKLRLPVFTVAGALMAVPVLAAEVDEMTLLTKPQSTFTLGAGTQSNDAPLSGMYSGRNESGGYLLGDLDIVRRYDESGTWVKLRGANLGLDSRELRFEHERQGDWGYAIEYNATPRHEPYTVTTTVTGLGTTTQTQNGTALRPVNLKTERERMTLEFKKYLPASFDFKIKFSNEERNGARLFGVRGGNFEFITEPVDSTTNQIDAALSYTGKALQLAAGYYGSFYDQHDNRVENPAGGRETLISQPPGNQMHQFYLRGGYNFTRSTRGTFKLKYAHTSQDETFIAPAANGRTDAGAEMDIFSAQIGATSRPTSKLSLLANASYENRDERTPVDVYITGVGAGSRHNGENTPQSSETATGKLQASYRLPQGFRFTGGVDYKLRLHSVPPVRAVVYRAKNEDVSFRGELARSLSETVNGRMSFTHSRRNGSAMKTNLTNGGTLGSNLINPLHIADRERDKLRLMVDWAPSEELSVQLMTWFSRDLYRGGPNPFGPDSGHSRVMALDASYLLNDDWTLTGWYSNEQTEAKSTTQCLRTTTPNCPTNPATRVTDLENTSHAFGTGLHGVFENGIKVGADLSLSFDRGEFTQTALTGLPVPDIDTVYYRSAQLKLFAEYDIRSNMGVRVDFIHDRRSQDDWQWEGFAFDDGTTVYQSPNQVDNFIGVSAYYKYW